LPDLLQVWHIIEQTWGANKQDYTNLGIGSATALLTNPIWVVNTRAITHPPATKPQDSAIEETKAVVSDQATGIYHAFRSIIKEDGLKGLFAGVVRSSISSIFETHN
jgi:adenine nucleotide transporter 17